jgi:hypothetical protein
MQFGKKSFLSEVVDTLKRGSVICCCIQTYLRTLPLCMYRIYEPYFYVCTGTVLAKPTLRMYRTYETYYKEVTVVERPRIRTIVFCIKLYTLLYASQFN